MFLLGNIVNVINVINVFSSMKESIHLKRSQRVHNNNESFRSSFNPNSVETRSLNMTLPNYEEAVPNAGKYLLNNQDPECIDSSFDSFLSGDAAA